MLNLSDKRQHFRFPAYDDEIGVKLVNNKRRDFLKDVLDDGFVYKKQESYLPNASKTKKDKIKSLTIDPVDMVDAPDYFGYEEMEETPHALPKERAAAYRQKEVKVEKGTRVLENNTYIEPSPTNYTAPQSSFSNKLFEADSYGNAKYTNRERRGSKFESSYDLPGMNGKSLFKPKHIPASLIDDQDMSQPKHSRDVIVEELRKASQASFLMLEDEVVLDPIIDSVELPITETPSLVPEKKKNQRLEKTLSGIIAEEGSTKLDSYYFD
ncbi:hypothetical protein DOK76_09375 [Vagococcus sp. DIV0080]|uniref:Uncharacterized protein n=1 Tax=Candidatus Vagococcus giribetii TaxID=2230876 RepID=A0ABS3HU63_9ENTE|nr:hypothetical protein [Vagococcus sp. DIV0080]MBO0477282.1 hypothetical protein [Vagococcus sp. DIV0080]